MLAGRAGCSRVCSRTGPSARPCAGRTSPWAPPTGRSGSPESSGRPDNRVFGSKWRWGNPALRAVLESDAAGWGGPERREPEVVVKPWPGEADDSLKIGVRRDAPAWPATPRLKLAGEPLPIPPPGNELSEEASRAP